ncbi:hypothetical protein [[Clostridium] fimetarium]|uniref:Uncharacterized protein n=1 Tax=[Clostridium] fimetarium TaxID=99656 RepID=A0A1I0RN86_9FIRM|nr:hypothetical protein [[Clostridium] fimetarium]SEW42697.1 hypothetical protein SAMN05421659_11963 [[Clostridium] fimetarium]
MNKVKSRYIANITQGDIFNIVQYINDITDDKDTRSSFFTKIIVSGYDASKVGDFPMDIYCTDSHGNSSNIVKSILHVKEKKAEAPTTAPMLLIAGNGGSATDSEHIDGELM